MTGSIYDWSRTASDNDDADGGINWTENQNPNTVNDSARAMMGRLAEFIADMGATQTTGGTADAQTLTTRSAFSTLATGRIVAFKAGATNTGAATFNVNTIGAKAVKKFTTAGEVALAAGDITTGGIYVVIYDSTAASGSGAWIMVNPTVVTINNANWSGTDLAVANGGTGSSTAGDARTALGLAIGTDVQAYDAELAALAGLTSAADKVPYFTGSGAAATATFTSAGRALVDDADAAAQRTTLGLVIGTNVQAYDADLDSWAGKTAPTGTAVGTSDAQTLTNKTIAAGSNTISGLATSMFAANVVDTDTSLTANSDTRLASQKAVKAYVDAHTASDTELTALAGLTSAADRLPYFTGSGTASLATFTSAGRALVDDADAAAQRTTLGLGTAAVLAETSTVEWLANTADRALSTDQVWAAGALTSLTDGANIAVDMSAGVNFTVTLGGNRTLSNPTNTKVGQTGVIYIVQDGTGSRTLAYGSNWKFAGGTDPTVSTAADTVDMLSYTVRTSSFIVASLMKGLA